MFLINITYKKNLTEVDRYLSEHRQFLDEGYKKNYFVVSGPKNPRTGGIIVSQLKDRKIIEAVIQQDPFYLNDIADYEIVEFRPVKYHHGFSEYVTGDDV